MDKDYFFNVIIAKNVKSLRFTPGSRVLRLRFATSEPRMTKMLEMVKLHKRVNLNK